jgi:hypothetical protein
MPRTLLYMLINQRSLGCTLGAALLVTLCLLAALALFRLRMSAPDLDFVTFRVFVEVCRSVRIVPDLSIVRVLEPPSWNFSLDLFLVLFLVLAELATLADGYCVSAFPAEVEHVFGRSMDHLM